MLSSAENRFLREATVSGVREDGRRLFDHRNFKISTGCIESANGSAHVSRAFSPDEVTCAVKYDVLTKSDSSFSMKGNIDFSLDLSRYTTHPNLSRQALEKEQKSIEHIFSQVLNDSFKDSVTVVANEIVLKVYVDCVVNGFNIKGNLVDLVSIAVYASLKTAQRVKIEKIDDISDENIEFFIKDSLIPLIASHEINSLFVCVSLFEVSGNVFITDANYDEELSSLSSITAFVDGNGAVCGLYMPQGKGGIMVHQIKKILSSAKKLSKNLFKTVEYTLK